MWLNAETVRLRLAGFALGVCALSLLPGTVSAQEVVEDARAALPESVRSAGVLRVATSLQWAPFAYESEEGEAVGIDIGLMKLLAAKLGLTAEITDIKFPSIVPGVSTGRYDVGVNQIGITEEREKVVDFVPYFNSGYSLLVRKGETDIDINNLCGRTLALTQGSAQIKVVEELSKGCVDAGRPEIGMQFYPNSADTYLAVANGRTDGFMTGKAVGVYTSRGNPKLEVAPGMLEGRRSVAGIIVGEDSDALRTALSLALESAVADGSYTALLEEHGVADGGLTIEEMHGHAADRHR